MLLEKALIDSSETLGQRFLMLIQSISGIRALTSVESCALPEQVLLNSVLDTLIQNLDMDKCSIFLLRGEELRCASAKSWDEKLNITSLEAERCSHVFRIGEGIMGIAARTGKIYHCQNCKTDENFLPIIHPHADRTIGSLICAPISVGQELMGVLNISHPHPEFFHSWQEHIIGIHANILAQMLHNNRLMTDMRAEVDKRTVELRDALKETLKLKTQFEMLSVVDELTQIHNRRYFFNETTKLLSRGMRQEEDFGLLVLDLDNFKHINDNYGHDYGDRVLKDVSKVLADQTRAGDIVARLGGEEFAFALPGSNTTGSRHFAERIRKCIEELSWTKDGNTFGITISIGIADLGTRKDETGTILNQLYKEADHALYQCKKLGRNQVISYQDSPN